MRLIFETVVLVFLAAVLFLGCSAQMAVQKPAEKTIQAQSTLIKGEIDSIREADFLSAGGEEATITLIGFKSGEGAIVSGIHPGLKEGKKVKIYLEKSAKTYKGTLIYEIRKIESGE